MPAYTITVNYLAYMEYGGSMGHNAPAGQHQTDMDIYYETFLLSNITPQEMVFMSNTKQNKNIPVMALKIRWLMALPSLRLI